MLTHFDFNLFFELHANGSDVGIRGVLNRQKKIVELYSAKLNRSERSYTTTEKDLLTIIQFLNHFQKYIFNSPVKIFTNHYNNIFNS
ncbi:hypothetical protein PAEPH01_2101 [Pancytospora epiphaga]|nr:hypothetical protein PAEPH01_2101 [Pancytospora epiphaga]